MIDYVKVQLFVDPPAFIQTLNANGYEVGGNYVYATGEAPDYPLKAENETLEVNFKSENFIQLSGSLHKHAHNGKNHSDFFFNDLLQTVFTLCKNLMLNPSHSIIHNIEFGVNINPPFVTKTFLKQVLCYKGVMFVPMKSRNGISLGIDCDLSHYRIKMYCKKSQYQLPLETLRFEIHVEKMQYLKEKKIEVKFLADLFKIETLIALGELLRKVFNDIVIYDPLVETHLLSTADKKVYELWSNTRKIEELQASDIPKFQYQRRRLRQIQNQHSTGNQQKIAARLIDEKINQLVTIDEKTSTILTDIDYWLVNGNFNHSYPSYKRKDSLKKPYPIINDTAPKYVQQSMPEKEFDKAAKQDGKIGERLNEEVQATKEGKIGEKAPAPIQSIDELRKEGKLIETSFLGTDGKFYSPNPIDPKKIAVYESPEAYNKRLQYPYYIAKEEADKLFSTFLPINWETLQTVNRRS